MIRVWRFALSRRWWAGHVLVLAGSVLFLRLARWQWDRAHSVSGDWQNFGYALQWPLFAGFLVAAWARFLWLEQHHDSLEQHHDSPQLPPVVTPTPTSAFRPTPEDDPDDELAAYNAYLAQLADEDRRR